MHNNEQRKSVLNEPKINGKLIDCFHNDKRFSGSQDELLEPFLFVSYFFLLLDWQ